MKRFFIIIGLILYLIPAIGVTISAHHCSGKITSVSLQFLDFGEKCTCGKKPMNKNCCKDESKTYKLKNEQQKAHQFTLKVFKAFTFPHVLVENFTLNYQQPLISSNYSTTDNPPENVNHPIYIHYCVFRI